MAGDSAGEAMGLMPLFPLHEVLFPTGVLPFHLFEPRYQALEREGRAFVIVLIRHGGEVGSDRVADVHEVGTLARAERVEELPDGSFSVLAHGLRRVKIRSVDRSQPYLRARVEPIPDPRTPPRPRLVALLERYLAEHGVDVPPEVAMQLVDPTQLGPARAVWLAGAMLREATLEHRQELLMSGDPALAEVLLFHELV